MNFNLEYDKNNGYEDWPLFLTPELRERLIQAKIARIQNAFENRDRQSKHKETCNETNCECH